MCKISKSQENKQDDAGGMKQAAYFTGEVMYNE